MTEIEWLLSENLTAMYDFLRRTRPLSKRQKRLWVAACAEHSGIRCYGYEAWSRGESDEDEKNDNGQLINYIRLWSTDHQFGESSPHNRAALLREIAGNPFAPLLHDRTGQIQLSRGRFIRCESCAGYGLIDPETRQGGSEGQTCPCCRGYQNVPAPWITWNDGCVVKLAQKIYDELTFDQLGILADMAEDGGCRDEGMLQHLRGWEWCWRCDTEGEVPTDDGDWGRCPDCFGTRWIGLRGPHTRGCWVIDSFLGLE